MAFSKGQWSQITEARWKDGAKVKALEWNSEVLGSFGADEVCSLKIGLGVVTDYGFRKD